ncbi:MAG: hypothetical protein AAGA31_18815 [Bacteroidota bacterium]
MIATTTTSAPTTTKFELVKGEFSATEAQEVLNSLIQSKINFHAVKNFRCEERSGQENDWCKERITALRQNREEVAALLKEAIDQGLSVEIQSHITIKVG